MTDLPAAALADALPTDPRRLARVLDCYRFLNACAEADPPLPPGTNLPESVLDDNAVVYAAVRLLAGRPDPIPSPLDELARVEALARVPEQP